MGSGCLRHHVYLRKEDPDTYTRSYATVVLEQASGVRPKLQQHVEDGAANILVDGSRFHSVDLEEDKSSKVARPSGIADFDQS